MILLFLSALFASTHAVYNISVYGDVHTDVEFFTRTFPWIIDNIGGEIIVDYYMLGSGRYSVPQMCALEDLKLNTFLQAQYLKCEAEGNPSAYCLCEAGIDPKTFKQCVALGGSLAGSASAKFSELGINFTPIIELEPRSTVFGVEDIWFLMKICTIFGDNLPRGCIHYSNQTNSFLEKKALAQFDRACYKEFPISCDDDKPVRPVTTTPPPWGTTTTSTPIQPWWSTTSSPWWSTTPPPTESTMSPPWWLTTATADWQTTPTPDWQVTHARLADDAHARLADDAHARLADDAHARLADDADARLAGDAHARLADDAHARLADDAHARLADDAHARLAATIGNALD